MTLEGKEAMHNANSLIRLLSETIRQWQSRHDLELDLDTTRASHFNLPHFPGGDDLTAAVFPAHSFVISQDRALLHLLHSSAVTQFPVTPHI